MMGWYIMVRSLVVIVELAELYEGRAEHYLFIAQHYVDIAAHFVELADNLDCPSIRFD